MRHTTVAWTFPVWLNKKYASSNTLNDLATAAAYGDELRSSPAIRHRHTGERGCSIYRLRGVAVA
jgi:hypothetical protein